MAKKEVMNEYIQPYTLNNMQIKNRIEGCIAYDENKYKDTKILFLEEENEFYKLPFTDMKISIAQELLERDMVLEDFDKPELIEETIIKEPEPEEEEPKISVLDEIYDFDEDAKKARYRSKIHDADTDAIIARIKAEAREKNKGKKVTTWRDINSEIAESQPPQPVVEKPKKKKKKKKVNTLAIIARIKREARAKNKGKKVISRRDINKELKPYLLKRNAGMNVDDDAMTSIDIYLNAVNRIETNDEKVSQNTSPLELNLKDILNDLDK